MVQRINKFIRKSFINYRGWNTNRKLLVIESDDWGSICLPDKKAYRNLLKKNIAVDKNRYNKFDTLERPIDLENLFDVLSKYKDKNGNGAVFTAVGLVANPDIERVRENDFKKYFRKSIFDTYLEFGYQKEMEELWDEGIKGGFFYPQFHGREHLNPSRWLKAIQESPEEFECFNQNGIPGSELGSVKYRAGFDYYDTFEKNDIEVNLEEGLRDFENIFGFASLSFCASQSICGDHINPILFDNGVRFHQNGSQIIPHGEKNKKLVKNRFWGDQSKEGLTYWRRNANFEPSKPGNDWVSSCLWEINNAFMFKKPAVISSHRVNFMGGLDEKNRTNSLAELERLLRSIVEKWPDVEFIHSETLGKIINNKDE
ncbi:MAG: hypothetical protein JXQ87_03420 [Bacteroidia bacterium]